MSRPSEPAAQDSGESDRRPLRLTRGIRATWWYTASGVLLFELVVALIWVLTLLEAGRTTPVLTAVGIAGLAWTASTVPLLQYYRHRTDESPWARWPRLLAPLVIAALVGLVGGLLSGLWLVAALPLVQSVLLLNWPTGVRARMVAAGTLLLGAAWFVDARMTFSQQPDVSWWLLGFFSATLPLMTALSLWWWDVLITVDRARASEARLAATQERLRVATDVHDLQGHHLQVIALQLELAERLMPTDPPAALEQLRAARASVDEARQGTRDLATRVRSVPLSDEIANAADLLRAAGSSVQTIVSPDADDAPASVLAPIIRETTTNALRHGGGAWARVALTREPTGWRYVIANDPGDTTPSADGSGLEGIGRRVSDAGGTLSIDRLDSEFAVAVTLPAETAGGVR
ncbi:sensor histidine kinase [Microbacterium hibisci]|uniref:sensor histidine kinase n=1 Tax=Microbacterium hibisci TaxID=2036000 RepID=UPI0019441D9D|nr:histidine kinase [Microbacterium hibisci]